MIDKEFNFENAIVAVDYNGVPIYDFAKMINCLIVFEQFYKDEAEEYLRTRLDMEYDGKDYVVLYRYD